MTRRKSKSITTDVRIREALNLAVDRQQIASVALAGSHGLAVRRAVERPQLPAGGAA